MFQVTGFMTNIMAILGIDYGAKKIGLAISGQNDSMALPLEILSNTGKDDVLKKLQSICQDQEIEKIIIGVPLSLKADSSEQKDLPNQQLKEVLSFIEWLKDNLDVPIEVEDERLSTKMATGLLKGTEKKGKDDAVAAMLILQTHLDKSKFQNPNYK